MNYLPDSAGHPIVSKVTFSAQQNGDFWSLSVVVGVGEFYDAGEQQVAALTLRTNERAEVREVARFGLNPFSVGVVKVLGATASKPRVNSRVQSISVEKLEANMLPEPYRLTLKNNSSKDVLAIQYNTYKNGQFLFLKWLGMGLPRPLIKAGEVYRLEALSEAHTCADPDGYRPAQSNRLDIVSAVFTDGSYEGEPGLAALLRGVALGNKKHLGRVVATLNNLSENEKSIPAVVIYQLRYLAEGIDETADSYIVDELENSLPPLGPEATFALPNFIRAGQHDVKTNLLIDAQQLEDISNKTQKAKAMNVWLTQTKAKYEHWLALAKAVTAH
ncbi:MAG: hypothetical protein DMF64_04560 [Acidobacteria bacterium]|nr:MAG: hypothetical protein DMF64_04560 [Acidobacteriota bacterium]